MSNKTPAARWREKGEADPHEGKYDCQRSDLTMGNLTDDELANEVFLNGDARPSIKEMLDGNLMPSVVYLTAAKERIRWLSRQLVTTQQQRELLHSTLEEAKCGLEWYQDEYPEAVSGADDEAMQRINEVLKHTKAGEL